MSIESTDLSHALRDYVKAAIKLLAEACPEAPPHILHGLEEWKRDSDDIFRLRDREEPFWVECMHSLQDRLHSLDEYNHLVSVLREIPSIAGQLDQLVGTAFSARRIEAGDIADNLIYRLSRKNDLRFDETQFEQMVPDFVSDLERTSLSIIIIIPLIGLNVALAPLQLAPDIEIDNMTDEEIVHCLSVGMLVDPFLRRLADIKAVAAVRVRYRLEKRVGSHDQTQFDNALQIHHAANEQALAVLHALRLFKDGPLSVPGLLEYSTEWPHSGHTSFQNLNTGRKSRFNKYNLNENEEKEFHVFWTRLKNNGGRDTLANAIRRFSDATERDRQDDKLVDLMIAAESLFLADAGSPQDRGELRYRLALRAAFFIDSPEYSRRAIFKHMKRAYDARSAIVHGGGEPKSELLKSPSDTPVSLRDFVKVTEHLLRAALKKRIDITEPGDSIDWDALIIPSS